RYSKILAAFLYSREIILILETCPSTVIQPRFVVRDDHFFVVAPVESGFLIGACAEVFASLSAARLCTLLLCPLTHSTSTRRGVLFTYSFSSFQRLIFSTGIPFTPRQRLFGQMFNAFR